MPKLSVWALRAALLYLLAGFTFGGLLLFHKGVPLTGALWALLPAHIEFLLVGWTLQLILGVAYWILPRHPQEPKRGDPRLAAAAFVLLNLGVLLAAFGPLAGSSAMRTGLVLAGRTGELLGVALFAGLAWGRVRGFK